MPTTCSIFCPSVNLHVSIPHQDSVVSWSLLVYFHVLPRACPSLKAAAPAMKNQTNISNFQWILCFCFFLWKIFIIGCIFFSVFFSFEHLLDIQAYTQPAGWFILKRQASGRILQTKQKSCFPAHVQCAYTEKVGVQQTTPVGHLGFYFQSIGVCMYMSEYMHVYISVWLGIWVYVCFNSCNCM